MSLCRSPVAALRAALDFACAAHFNWTGCSARRVRLSSRRVRVALRKRPRVGSERANPAAALVNLSKEARPFYSGGAEQASRAGVPFKLPGVVVNLTL